MTGMTDTAILSACKTESNPIQYLMEEFEYDSKDALFDAIKNIYPVAGKLLIRALSEKNVDTVPEVVAEEVAENMPNDFNVLVEANPSKEILNSLEIEALPDDKSEFSEELVPEDGAVASDELEKLKQKADELSTKVVQLETKEKKLKGMKSENRIKLQNARKALYELQKILSFQENNLTTIIEELSAYDDEFKTIQKEKSEANAELEKVRNQIYLLQKVTIWFFEDATISIDNADTPMIDELERTKNFSKLFALPAAGKLTLDEVRALASLLEIVKQYQERCYEIIFDKPQVQQVWEKIIK